MAKPSTGLATCIESIKREIVEALTAPEKLVEGSTPEEWHAWLEPALDRARRLAEVLNRFRGMLARAKQREKIWEQTS